MRAKLTTLAVALWCMVAASGSAFALINGEYKVTVQTTLTPPNCKWIGSAMMEQNGTNLTGRAGLHLDMTSNPDPVCVSAFQVLQGNVTGTVMGTTVDFHGKLGPYTAHFIGTTSHDGLSSAAGTWTATVGSLNAHGVFDAELVLSATPVFDAKGMAMLVLVLFAVAAWSMRRIA